MIVLLFTKAPAKNKQTVDNILQRKLPLPMNI